MPCARLIICIAAVSLGGCASAPGAITSPAPGPGVSEARADPERHAGDKVRWGGTISDVSNLEDHTIIAVVARPLTRRGEPQHDRPALGRFFAEVDRFLDPEEYQSGRRVTVVGRFTGVRPSKIDQYTYDYPVVQVQHLYLWQEYARRDPYHFHPYYPPFPYWRHPYRHHHHGFIHHPW